MLSWELFNETELLSTSASDIASWHNEMATLIRAYDPHQRAVTTSFANGGDGPGGPGTVHSQTFANLDYINIHRYVKETDYPNDNAKDIWFNGIKNYKESSASKATIIGEADSWVSDPVAYNYHSQLWATALMGGLGPLNHWEWDFFIDKTQATMPATVFMTQLNSFSKFYAEIPFIGKNDNVAKKIAPFGNDNLRVYYLQNNALKKIFGYVQDENYQLNKLISGQTVSPYALSLDPAYKPARASLHNKFTITGLVQNGTYKIQWYNTENGHIDQEYEAITTNNSLTLLLPAESLSSPYGDAAFIIEFVCGIVDKQLVPSSTNTVMKDVDLQFGNGAVFYPRASDGTIYKIHKPGLSWNEVALNTAAPKMLSGTASSIGIEVVPQNNNEIYYAAHNQFIYRMYWDAGLSTWSYEMASSDVNSKARRDTEIHYSNGAIYYVRYDGIIVYQKKVGSTWELNWLNPAAPKVKVGTGFTVVPELNSTIFYVGTDDYIYRLYWTSANGWVYEKTSSNNVNERARPDTEVRCVNNSVFYIRQLDGKLMIQQQTGTTWVTNWLSESAPEVMDGTGISIKPDNSSVFYTGKDGNIYQVYWTSGNGWVYKQFNLVNAASGGGKGDQNLIYADNQIFYVGKNDSKVRRISDCDGQTGYKLSNSNELIENETTLDPVQVNEQFEPKIFPNPSEGKFKIYSPDHEFNSVELFDSQGKLIHEYHLEPSDLYEIDDIQLQPGLYFVKVNATTNNSEFLRLVIH